MNPTDIVLKVQDFVNGIIQAILAGQGIPIEQVLGRLLGLVDGIVRDMVTGADESAAVKAAELAASTIVTTWARYLLSQGKTPGAELQALLTTADAAADAALAAKFGG